MIKLPGKHAYITENNQNRMLANIDAPAKDS